MSYVIEKPGESRIAKMVGSKETSVPVIKMYGCTQEGHSVMVNIHGVLPYIYVPVPTAKIQPGLTHQDVCDKFRTALNVSSTTFLRTFF